MEASKPSVRLELLINNERVAIAGLPDRGVLNTIVNWVRRDPKEAPPQVRERPGFDAEEFAREAIDVHLGGLDACTNEHVRWCDCELQVGDEVTVRVLPPGDFDAPAARFRSACGLPRQQATDSDAGGNDS